MMDLILKFMIDFVLNFDWVLANFDLFLNGILCMLLCYAFYVVFKYLIKKCMKKKIEDLDEELKAYEKAYSVLDDKSKELDDKLEVYEPVNYITPDTFAQIAENFRRMREEQMREKMNE